MHMVPSILHWDVTEYSKQIDDENILWGVDCIVAPLAFTCISFEKCPECIVISARILWMPNYAFGLGNVYKIPLLQLRELMQIL